MTDRLDIRFVRQQKSKLGDLAFKNIIHNPSSSHGEEFKTNELRQNITLPSGILAAHGLHSIG